MVLRVDTLADPVVVERLGLAAGDLVATAMRLAQPSFARLQLLIGRALVPNSTL